MSNISVMLGCCFSEDEMEVFMKEYPDYIETEGTKKSFLKNDEIEFVVKFYQNA